MKIVCDNCATKYQIADEKVSGKAFKIRCKKCGHVIVVNKGPGDAGAGQAGAAEAGAKEDAPAPAAEAAPPSDSVWHLVIDREQVGPMTPEEVRAKVKAGQVDAETYGWREGFDDWLKLSAIEDFKGFFAAAPDDQATRRTDGSERAPSPAAAAPAADIFGAGAPVVAASAGAATIVSDGMQAPDLAALGLAGPNQAAPAPAPSYSPSPSYGQAQAPAAAPADYGSDGGDAPVKSMTNARSENSVLFSLNNLSALAGGGGGGGSAAKPAASAQPGYGAATSEASGLIDIRAMAAATLGPASVGGAGPSISNRGLPDMLGGSDAPPVFTPLAPAVMLPSNEPAGIPKWVFILVGLGGLMFVGMIVTVIVVLREPSGGPVATNGGPAKDPAGSAGTGPSAATNPTKDRQAGTADPPAAAAKDSASPGTKPAATADAPAKGSEKKQRDPSSKKEPKGDKPSKSKEPEKAAEAAPPPKVEAPVVKKPAEKPKAKDDLDSLLDGASGGNGGKPVKAAQEDLPEQLSMSQIQGTLKGINVSSCKDAGASGVVQVKLTIGKDGKVSAANPSGGSGAGPDCVAGKVRSAKFGKFSGDPMTLTFPFIVR